MVSSTIPRNITEIATRICSATPTRRRANRPRALRGRRSGATRRARGSPDAMTTIVQDIPPAHPQVRSIRH
ncbi:hypothetical protein GCM10022261_11460 [Brevibacterium daeguense]|uniref:Uncharacterized protein n=1 Tax=Brevibacterium daeguense TaxID=909936 RepID=A0ABP8EI45_9MICO